MYLSTFSGRFRQSSELSVSRVEANQILDLKMEDFVEETSQFPALSQEE